MAIDLNSGRATKEGSIEDTATKTNLEAAEEIARQLRLRDLAGLIVIDFIDMEERKNNAAVEKKLKDKLKTDRARIQVGRISGFGLLEMSRQRLRPGMIEATTAPCTHCHGTGIVRSDDSLALSILRQLEEEGTRKRSKEVLLKAPIAIVNFLMNQKREHVAQIETRYGMAVRIEADPSLISPDFSIERFKTATRVVPEALTQVVSIDASVMEDLDADLEIEEEDDKVEVAEAAPVETSEAEGDESQPKKRRRRRRRNSQQGEGNGEASAQSGDSTDADEGGENDAETPVTEDGDAEASAEPEATPVEAAAPVTEDAPVAAAETPEAEVAEEEAPTKPVRKRRSRAKNPVEASADAAAEAMTKEVAAEPATTEPAPVEASAEDAPAPKKRVRKRTPKKPAAAEAEAPAAEAPTETIAAEAKVAEEVLTADVPAPADPAAAEETPSKPKRRGWWSLGS